MSYHNKGDITCMSCCCGYPKKCPCKTGLIHTEVVDEVQISEDEWDWNHTYKCDGCNKTRSDYPHGNSNNIEFFE